MYCTESDATGHSSSEDRVGMKTRQISPYKVGIILERKRDGQDGIIDENTNNPS